MTERVIRITQGEFAASGDEATVISTLLGSCVACCVWDPQSRVGGMNHMLLTVQHNNAAHSNMAGVNAMELLINEVIKLGGKRDRLHAKAFGGARMITGLSDIGEVNARFTLDFLERERILCLGHSLGGDKARVVKFWPSTGRALQRVSTEEVNERPAVTPQPAGNDMELF